MNWLKSIWGFIKNNASTIVPAAAAAGATYYGARADKKAQERTIKANRELAEYTYSKDLEMWERANQYNAPEAQMDRLGAAGLNPNLVYGAGSVSGNAATQLPKYDTPRADYRGVNTVAALPSMIESYQNFQAKDAQIDNLRAQNSLIKRQSLLTARKGETELHKGALTGEQAITAGTLNKYQHQMLEEDVRGKSLENVKRHEDALTKRLENDLRRQGIHSNDPWFARVLARMLLQLGFDPADFVKSLSK